MTHEQLLECFAAAILWDLAHPASFPDICGTPDLWQLVSRSRTTAIADWWTPPAGELATALPPLIEPIGCPTNSVDFTLVHISGQVVPMRLPQALLAGNTVPLELQSTRAQPEVLQYINTVLAELPAPECKIVAAALAAPQRNWQHKAELFRSLLALFRVAQQLWQPRRPRARSSSLVLTDSWDYEAEWDIPEATSTPRSSQAKKRATSTKQPSRKAQQYKATQDALAGLDLSKLDFTL